MKAVTAVNVWKVNLKGHRVKHTEGMQGPERGGGRQAPVSTVSTQCTDETNTKRKALPPGEKGLWVHSQESQDSTPRKGQEKEVPCTQSDLPPRDKEICEDHCLWDVLLATEYSPSLQACSRHGIGSLRTKHPSEKSRAGAWFALIKSEVSSVLWIQPGETHLKVVSNHLWEPPGDWSVEDIVLPLLSCLAPAITSLGNRKPRAYLG